MHFPSRLACATSLIPRSMTKRLRSMIPLNVCDTTCQRCIHGRFWRGFACVCFDFSLVAIILLILAWQFLQVKRSVGTLLLLHVNDHNGQHRQRPTFDDQHRQRQRQTLTIISAQQTTTRRSESSIWTAQCARVMETRKEQQDHHVGTHAYKSMTKNAF